MCVAELIWATAQIVLQEREVYCKRVKCGKGRNYIARQGLYCNMRWLAWEEIVLQYSLVAGLRVSLYCNKEGRVAGEGSVSRYIFCIVTEAARLD